MLLCFPIHFPSSLFSHAVPPSSLVLILPLCHLLIHPAGKGRRQLAVSKPAKSVKLCLQTETWAEDIGYDDDIALYTWNGNVYDCSVSPDTTPLGIATLNCEYEETEGAANTCDGIITIGSSAIYYTTVLDDTTTDDPDALASGRFTAAIRTLGKFPKEPEQIQTLAFSKRADQSVYEMEVDIVYKSRGYNPLAVASRHGKLNRV